MESTNSKDWPELQNNSTFIKCLDDNVLLADKTTPASLKPALAKLLKMQAVQESTLKNIIEIANTIEVEGQKISLIDFIMMFDEILTGAAHKIAETSKHAMQAIYLIDECAQSLGSLKTSANIITASEPEISGAVCNMQTIRDILERLATYDIQQNIEAKDKLEAMTESMIIRNMQLKLFLDNSALKAEMFEEPIKNIIEEIKFRHPVGVDIF